MSKVRVYFLGPFRMFRIIFLKVVVMDTIMREINFKKTTTLV